MRQEIKDLAQEFEYTNGTYGFIEGVKHQEKENDLFAIKFAEWCDKNYNTLKPYNSINNLLLEFKKEVYEATI
jgi:hypothetical protein